MATFTGMDREPENSIMVKKQGFGDKWTLKEI